MIEAINYVWKNSAQKGSPLLLLLAIADYCNDDWCAWPSIDSLSKKTRLSRRNVQYLVDDLVKSKELIVHENKGRNGTHLYQVSQGGVQTLHPCNPAPPDCTQSVRNRQPKYKSESASIPENLNTLTFTNSWADWCKDRRDKRQPITETAAKRQLAKLSAMGEKRAIAAIDFSITQGYTGIFEQNSNGTDKRHHTKSSRNIGTTNDGKASQYAGVGKVVSVSSPERSST